MEKISNIIIDRMDFVLDNEDLIKARRLGDVEGFLKDITKLIESYGFSKPKTIIFGSLDLKITNLKPR